MKGTEKNNTLSVESIGRMDGGRGGGGGRGGSGVA